MPNYGYDEIIKQSQENVKKLSEKLNALDKLHQDIRSSNDKFYEEALLIKKSSEAIPDAFKAKFEEIVQFSKHYTNVLGESTKTYLDGNNTLFTTKLSELSVKTGDLKKEIDRLINTDLTESFDILQKIFIDETRKNLDIELKKFEAKSDDLQIKINDLKKEVTRLVNTDFTKLFDGLQKVFIDQTRKDFDVELKKFEAKSLDLQIKIDGLKKEVTRLVNTDFIKLFEELQKVFIDQTRKDLAVELKKFQDKSNDFQTKIYEFKKQIDRLDSIDLVKHFDKLQKTLSEIFGAINAINLTLTSITQNLNAIAQSLGTIQRSITQNHIETLKTIDIFRETVIKHLAEQDKTAKSNMELLENKINILVEHNELLRKGIKSNRTIQFIGFIVILIVLIYSVFKH